MSNQEFPSNGSKHEGLTVNERLYVSGNLPAFEKALKEKDTEKVISILKSIDVDEASITAVLVHVGLIRKNHND